MEKSIKIIFEELYEIDPAFREREEELIKTIEKLVASKPDVKMDEDFKQTLKTKLLEEMQKKKKRPILFRFIPAFSAAAVFLIAIVVGINFIGDSPGNMSTEFAIRQDQKGTKNEVVTKTMEEKSESKDKSGKGEEDTVFLYKDKMSEAAPEPQAPPASPENNDPAVTFPDESLDYGSYRYEDKPQPVTIQTFQRGNSETAKDDFSEHRVFKEKSTEDDYLMQLNIAAASEGSGAKIRLDPQSYSGESGDSELLVNEVPAAPPIAGLALEPESKKPLTSTDSPVPAEETYNTEEYERIYENPFLDALTNPLSTFSIDVDTASFANVRRFINSGTKPYADAVRIEELINYFTYDYPEPAGDAPFSFTTEIARAPWNEDNRLVHVGLKGRSVTFEEQKNHNLVFLLDVSGSMNSDHKLPLLKKAFTMLVDELSADDRVAIVVYAGAAGLVLESTPGNRKGEILDALNNLNAGGSTAGGAGIQLAYKTALDYFKSGGNNRIILATDGDFNVGASSDSELDRMIEEKRKSGVFLTVLGFGSGNYKDSKMESLADKGNGNYAYIDSIMEAQKVLVHEIGGTLTAIAKDVKIQIEFNPAKVKSYRLIGYENRVMRAEDFADDTKDAGELGSGHTVTALYEIVPADGQSSGEPLKYQSSAVTEEAALSNDVMTLKFRYKQPEGDTSQLIEVPVQADGWEASYTGTSANFRFSAAVAAWGMLLRDSQYKGNFSFNRILDLAGGALGDDLYGYRRAFLDLVEKSRSLYNRQ